MDNWTYFDEKYGQPFGKGAQCHVYRKGDLAVKVLTPGHELMDVMREAYALSMAEYFHIPTSNLAAAYREQGHVVMEMKYVAGKELMEEIFACVQRGDMATALKHLETMVDIQVKMHTAEAFGLQSSLHYMRAIFTLMEGLEPERREALLRLVDALPDGHSLCHNDYHARNILFDGQRYSVIDWDSASIGDPAGDVAHTYLTTLLSSRELADGYLKLYLSKTGMERERLRPWLPLHAHVLHNALRKNPENAPLCALLEPYLTDF